MIILRVIEGAVILSYTIESEQKLKNALYKLTYELTERKVNRNRFTGSITVEPGAAYYIHDQLLMEYRFHRVHMMLVRMALVDANIFNEIKIIKDEAIKPLSINIKYTNKNKLPREDQLQYIDFLTKTDKHIRVLPAYPGAGKTLTTIAAMCELRVKTIVFLSASLFDNWVDSFLELTNLTRDDIVLIKGSEELIRYYNNKCGWKKPVVIVSIDTFRSFMNSYSENKKFPMTPEEFLNKPRFGLKVVDEAHRCMHFHALADMYSNIRQHLFLTGTLMKESPFLANMENRLFSLRNRCPVKPPTSHLKMITYRYYFETIPRHKGAMGYNHMMFESAILKNKRLKLAYFNMCLDIMEDKFTNVFKPKEVALIFFSRVPMVEDFTKFLQRNKPNLNVVSYLAGEGEEKFKGADIIVSTIQKCGTGTDIAGLVFILQTVMVGSMAENHQNALRLRARFDGNTVFSYLWCEEIPTHANFHRKRIRELSSLYNSLEHIDTGLTL